MKLKEYLLEVEKFIAKYLSDSHMDKYILGLSGGVDSSLVAALTRSAVGKDKLICVAMPIESNEADLIDAKEVAKELDVELKIVDGTEIFRNAKKDIEKIGISLDRGTLANLKVRIRMSILYAIAQHEKGLVIGTDNADERYTGYFTKYGDGGVDVLPIPYLLKREVVEGCKIYGLSNRLAERVPTAGLFEGQTDESEMGVSYETLDNFLLGQEIDEKSNARIEHLHRISEHKRAPLPTPVPFDRD